MDGRIGNPQDCNPRELASIKEECQEKVCVRWFTGYWSKCSVSCGRGIETREVECRTYESVAVTEEHCSGMVKPNSTRECNMEECLVSGTILKKLLDNSVMFCKFIITF